MSEKTRVQKFIAVSGLCSRRKAEDLIKEGKVKVNGKIIEIGAQCFETDKIEITDNKHIDYLFYRIVSIMHLFLSELE